MSNSLGLGLTVCEEVGRCIGAKITFDKDQMEWGTSVEILFPCEVCYPERVIRAIEKKKRMERRIMREKRRKEKEMHLRELRKIRGGGSGISRRRRSKRSLMIQQEIEEEEGEDDDETMISSCYFYDEEDDETREGDNNVKKVSVLCVDDQPICLNFLSLFLREMGFRNAETSLTESDALEKMKEKEFDILITDFNLVAMNSVEMLQKGIGENDFFLPKIRICASGAPGDVVNVKDSSSDEKMFHEVISKPYLFDSMKLLLGKYVSGIK